MPNGQNAVPVKSYLLFDTSTGRILGRHSIYDAATRTYVEGPLEEVRSIFGDQIRGKTAAEYEIMAVELPSGHSVGGYTVDVKTRKLVTKPRLQVRVERTQLQGDGKDSIQIQITVLGDGDKVANDFNGDLRVTTTRGRLSAPGGRIKAKNGNANISLTSAAETVDKVFVAVRDVAGLCVQGTAYLEFV